MSVRSRARGSPVETADTTASRTEPASELNAPRSDARRPDLADFILLGTATLVAIAVLTGLALAIF
jgi:hypothetical protein